ncbi:hypothetical protein ACHWQZ_G016730 [Mnemiopsis leidyi]
MERVKNLMIILMKERDRARKRVDDLNLELKITTEKLLTTEKDKQMLQAKIKLLDNELDRAYEENIGMKTANTDLEYEVEKSERLRSSQQNELQYIEREVSLRESKYNQLEETLNVTIEACMELGE